MNYKGRRGHDGATLREGDKKGRLWDLYVCEG